MNKIMLTIGAVGCGKKSYLNSIHAEAGIIFD